MSQPDHYKPLGDLLRRKRTLGKAVIPRSTSVRESSSRYGIPTFRTYRSSEPQPTPMGGFLILTLVMFVGLIFAVVVVAVLLGLWGLLV